MPSSARLREVDALRGLAALAVLLFHYTTRFERLFHPTDQPLAAFPWGHYGVNLFFIISGFVIFMTLERVRAPMDFVVSRFSRLYPAYWVAIALTFACTHLLELPGLTVDGWAALGNALMFHGLFRIPHVDGVYWTLQVELLFYLWMLLLFLSGRLAAVHFPLYGLLALRLVYFVAEHWLGVSLPWRLYVFLILGQIPWFAIGIALYRLSSANNGLSLRHDLAILATALAVLALAESPAIALLAILLAGLVYGGATGRLPFLASAPLVWLGAISYPLYLLHENIGWSIMLRLGSLGWGLDLSILGATAASLLLAWAVSRLVERPAMNRIRAWYRQSRHPAAA